MKFFKLFLVCASLFISMACTRYSEVEIRDVSDEKEIVSKKIESYDSKECQQLFNDLNAINDSIRALNLSTRSREDWENLSIIAADVQGAIYGAKLGWKNGKGIGGKISLSVAYGAIFAAAFSFMAAIVYNPMQAEAYIGDAEDSNAPVYALYLFEERRDALINTSLLSFDYRCTPYWENNEEEFIEQDYSEFEIFSGIDYNYLIPNAGLYVFNGENAPTKAIDPRVIPNIHNDVLSLVWNNESVSYDYDQQHIEEWGLDYFDSDDFNNRIEEIKNKFIDEGLT